MHIPGNMLEGHVETLTNSVSAAALFGAIYFAMKSKFKPSGWKFAGVSSLIFALQMLNFSVQNGTSGHLVGAVAAVFLLGPAFGVLAIFLVLAVQAFVFADGGVFALGANVLNMALAGGLIGWGAGRLAGVFEGEATYAGAGELKRGLLLGAAAWLAVMAGAFLCSLELALSGVVSFNAAAAAMLPVHFLIGLGEVAISIAIYAGYKVFGKYNYRDQLLFASASLTALFISPFASSFPDGLEYSFAKLSIIAENGASLIMTPLADYSVPGISSPFFATSLAGLLGVFVVTILGLLFAKIFAFSLVKINAPK